MANRTLLMFARAGALASLLCIVLMSIVPGSNRPAVDIAGWWLLGSSGVVEHIVGYALCGFLFAIGFERWPLFSIGMSLAALAVILEVSQIFVPGRNATMSDAVYSAVAAAVGIVIASFLRRDSAEHLSPKV